MYFIVLDYHYDLYKFKLNKWNAEMSKLLDGIEGFNIHLVVKGEELYQWNVYEVKDLLELIKEEIEDTEFDEDKNNSEIVVKFLENECKLVQLQKELNKEQKIEFIRSVQSLYWTMTSAEVLRGITDEELDKLLILQYRNLPGKLLERTVRSIKEKIK